MTTRGAALGQWLVPTAGGHLERGDNLFSMFLQCAGAAQNSTNVHCFNPQIDYMGRDTEQKF